MRQSFWIVNSALLLLGLLTFGLIYFSRPSIPERKRIEPASYRAPSKTESATFNISNIYQNDLFDTYQPELAPIESTDRISAFPEPPALPEPWSSASRCSSSLISASLLLVAIKCG